MPQPMQCPRCGGSFDCGAQDGHCDCFELHLTPAHRADIAANFADCLCVACLRQIADGAPAGVAAGSAINTPSQTSSHAGTNPKASSTP